MSEMIERVARALYESPGSDMIAKTGDAFPIPPWDKAHPAVKDHCRVQARAAIKAMRAPTNEMMVEAETQVEELATFADKGKSPSFIAWQAMIEAALR